jgi:HAD superfamily hydrolase (TIGR01509 family)
MLTTGHALLMDADGTLLDSLGMWTDSYRGAIESRGGAISPGELRKIYFGNHQAHILQHFDVGRPSEFIADVWSLAHSRVATVELFPGVLETVVTAKDRGIRTAVVTNSRSGHVKPAFDRHGLTEHLDAVITSEDVAQGKPDPASILLALEKLQVPPRSAWMVGDTLADIHAGQAAGVRTVAFYPPENHLFLRRKTLERAKPDHVVASFAELQMLLLGPASTNNDSAAGNTSADQ